jgi:hypothetical protein
VQETRSAATKHSPADVGVREVEEQKTDDERFSLSVSLIGENRVIQLARDGRIPRGDTHELGLHVWRTAPRCHETRVP